MLCCATALPAGAGEWMHEPSPKNPGGIDLKYAPVNHWRFSAGYIYRDLGDVDFRSGSRSQNLVIPRFFGNDRNRVPRIGSLGGVGDRFYDNGFVRVDVSGSVDGQTWFWGYNNASQVQGPQLVFRNSGGSAREVTSSRSFHPAGDFGEDIEEGGPYVQLEYMMGINEQFSWGPQLGFSFIDFDVSQTSSTFSAAQGFTDYRVSYEDRFNLNGVIPPLPPYAGTFGGPGPLIPNIPASRSSSRDKTDSGNIRFFNRLDESLEVDMYTFSPGLSFEFRKNWLYLNAAAGLSVNVVDWEAHNRETLYASRNYGKAREYRKWSDRKDETDVLFGAYVQGTVGVQLTEKVSVSAFARYDWNEDLHGSVGPSSFDVDLSGVSGGAMVTIRW